MKDSTLEAEVDRLHGKILALTEDVLIAREAGHAGPEVAEEFYSLCEQHRAACTKLLQEKKKWYPATIGRVD